MSTVIISDGSKVEISELYKDSEDDSFNITVLIDNGTRTISVKIPKKKMIQLSSTKN
jgi:hypothetical protein